jgi:sulfur transfer complex TusBCD TusB component (DsrH family)
MTIFTAAHGEAAAERLATEQQAIIENLINLEDHPGRKLLNSTALEGVSLACRAEVLDGLAMLWLLYESYRSAAVRVRAVMARRSRLTRAAIRAVESLVTGAAMVAVPHPEGSGAPRKLSLNELVAEIHTLYGRVHEVVTAVEQVWSELTARIDHCDTVLRNAERLAVELGLTADQDPAPGVLSRLAVRLGEVRRIVLTDPLQLWADGVVAAAGTDHLIAQCEQAHIELYALEDLRQQAAQRCDRIGATLTEMSELRQEIAEQRHQIRAKILAAPVGELRTPPIDSLGSRLTAARDLHRHRQWRPLATDLLTLERDTAAALTCYQTELIEAGGPFRERAELRGRLGAYHAKAAALGRIEDLQLDQRYQRARESLWRAPCDLVTAAAAVAEYQDAVNLSAMHGDPV